MELINIIGNLTALVSSFAAVIMLMKVSKKIGGSIGHMLKFLVLGIFFAVFIHSGFELLAIFQLIDQVSLMKTMGILLTVGSLCFIFSGLIGLKMLK